jgi:DNA polymerase III subunit delta
MKRTGREAVRFLERPEPGVAAILLFGADAMRVALKRQALVLALIGPEGGAEMRLARMTGADLRRDPAALSDAVRATGFFPGPRAVLVEEAGEGVAEALAAVLGDWRAGDAVIVLTAGPLNASSGLRKLVERAGNAVAIGVYDDPPDRADVEAMLARAGLDAVPSAALSDVMALAAALDPGDLAQFVEKLALYKRGDPAPLSAEDILACAPEAGEAEVGAILDLAAEGRADALAVAMRRLGGGAGAATGLVIAAGRHFRTLHAAACGPDGPEAALARTRPPVFGPRRNRMAAQARRLGPDQLERALTLIFDTDLALRSSRPPPGLAAAERLLVRIAMLRRS